MNLLTRQEFITKLINSEFVFQENEGFNFDTLWYKNNFISDSIAIHDNSFFSIDGIRCVFSEYNANKLIEIYNTQWEHINE